MSTHAGSIEEGAFYTQADRLLEKKMDTVALTLAKINAKALFKTLADMVAVVKFKKLADKLPNFEGQRASRFIG